MLFFIYYLMGLTGAEWMIWDTFFPEVPWQYPAAETGVISLFLLFWHRRIRKTRNGKKLMLCVPVLMFAAWRSEETLKEGFHSMYRFIFVTCWNHFYPADLIDRHTIRWDLSVCAAYGLVLALFAWLLYQAAVIRINRAVTLLLLSLPVAAVLTVGVAPPMTAVSLLIFCGIGVFAGSCPGKYGIGKKTEILTASDGVREGKRRKSSETRIRQRRMITATVSGAFLLLASFFLVRPFSEAAETEKLEARRWIWDTFTFTSFDFEGLSVWDDFPGLSDRPGELSNVDRIRYTGERIARVCVQEKPEETVYLKNYSGSVYTGYSWEQAEYGDGFSIQSAESSRVETEISRLKTMEIRLENSDGSRYVPYFSWEVSRSNNTVKYLYGSKEEYAAVNGWENRQEEPVNAEQYLEWPETLEDLREICMSNPVQGTDQIRNFIVNWLSSQCTYNLQVGRFPEDEDPIAFFLFEKKEGYCQHFASAAVMMFRMYGIPARYATGLAVSPGLFRSGGEEGLWTAYPTDYCAHAWVEIWQEEFGWIPVEVTPGGAGRPEGEEQNQTADSVAQEQNMQRQEVTEMPEVQETEEPDGLPETEDPEKKKTGNGEKKGGELSSVYRKVAETAVKILRAAAVCFLVMAAMVMTLLIRRTMILAVRRKNDYDGRFRDLMKVMEKGGMPPGSDWLSDDFPKKTAERFPWADEDTLTQLTETEEAILYGNRKETRREKAEIHVFYMTACRNLCKEMNLMQKFRFRIWDCWF